MDVARTAKNRIISALNLETAKGGKLRDDPPEPPPEVRRTMDHDPRPQRGVAEDEQSHKAATDANTVKKHVSFDKVSLPMQPSQPNRDNKKWSIMQHCSNSRHNTSE